MLNACPRCQRSFPAEGSVFCPDDGTRLQPLDAVPLPRDPSDPIIGSTLAERYVVRRTVADGGMGRVYEAIDSARIERVAVKVLHKDIADDEVNLERFRREATTSQQLDHPNIVSVLDFRPITTAPGRDGQVWILVMEFLDGEELSALLKREHRVAPARIVRVVSQLAVALDAAHAKGFVHRDLKPDNIFLVRSPEGDLVKLLDFGSVKFTKGQDKHNKLTVMGTTIGSPFYMSPEQAQGSPDLDHRADVWAVGVIVYEMSVGKVPFSGPNGPQILFKILGNEPEPPSFVRDDSPPGLDDFITHALKKSPAERYQTVGELADALGHALGLRGSHIDWSASPEHFLAEHLSLAPAPTPSPPTPSPPTPSPPTPSPPTPSPPTPSPPTPSPSFTDDGPLTLPQSRAPMVFALVSLALVLVGAIAFFLLRG